MLIGAATLQFFAQNNLPCTLYGEMAVPSPPAIPLFTAGAAHGFPIMKKLR